jgi:hypothetical protein
MPAERSKATAKRSNGGQATQIVWAVDRPTPTEAHTNNVSFVANITPNSFEITPSPSLPSSILPVGDEPPPLVDPPAISEFQLFPVSYEDGSPSSNTNGSKRNPHSKKKPDNHIPRPPNAFILFRSSFIKSQHVSAEVETNHSTLSKIIGMTWQNLPDEQRQAWHEKARIALTEHRKKFPKYTFRPAQNKVRCKAPAGGGGHEKEGTKRRVREVEPKDLKRCAKIAELLVEGKKGAELDAAIQEFDRYHVPEIITRFEAPITARAFRRSSSAPIPDTENSKKGQTFMLKSPVLRAKDGKRKLPRSTSIQPIRPGKDDNRVDELIAATLKQEPSMDFSAFSFASFNQQPGVVFEGDPLTPIAPAHSPPLLRTKDACSAPAPLTIPNVPSFLMDDWSVTSSPISPFGQCDTFSIPSPITPFDNTSFDTTTSAFDGSAFEALDLNSSCNKQFTLADQIDLANMSLPPSYDPAAGVGINMFDMDMSRLVTGFEGTEYMDLLAQPPCSQHQYEQQHHQPLFTPNHHQHHGYQQHHHIPNLSLDLTALMTANLTAPTEFVI